MLNHNQKNSPVSLDGSRANQSSKKISKGTKEYTILNYLINGNSLNRFEAENLGDHCLPSTISYFCNTKSLSISRKREKINNSFGGKTSVSRYWLSDKQRKVALRLLDYQ